MTDFDPYALDPAAVSRFLEAVANAYRELTGLTPADGVTWSLGVQSGRTVQLTLRPE